MNIIELNNQRLALDVAKAALLATVNTRFDKLFKNQKHTVDPYVTEHHIKLVNFEINENDDVKLHYIYGHVFNQYAAIPSIFFEIEDDNEAVAEYEKYLENMV